MMYRITNGSVEFGAETVLAKIDFEIHDREKVAIVGRNGAGKTTLLKCITGEVEMTEGTGDEPFSVAKAENPVIGYLRQIAFEDDSRSLLDELLTAFGPLLDMERRMKELLEEIETDPDDKKIREYASLGERFEFEGGYTYQKEYLSMLRKFGFSDEDLNRPLGTFSGGQRTKIAFMKLLLSHPDILLLDEPTNHLDISAVKWLEGYIRNYRSAVVIVSHDRMFIERTAQIVYEIEYGETRCYKGNYSDFERQKKENYIRQLKDYEYQQKEIRRLTALVERFKYKPTKASMARSKLKQIEHMQKADRPDRYDLKSFHASFQPEKQTVKSVLLASGLEVGYDSVLAELNFELLRGQKLGVIGDNGTGKSTLLKTLVGELEPLGGEFSFGLRAQIGYFNQLMAQFSSDKTVLEEFWDEFPQLTETQARTALGSFLFTGDNVYKRVSDLSGGERVTLALCKIFRRRPNVLILDEPTNHMDIVGKETLENMLCAFEGTVIVVSHDRYLINKVADRLIVFENGGAAFYPFSYAEYEERERARQEEEERTAAEASAQAAEGKAGAKYGAAGGRIPAAAPKRKKQVSTPRNDRDRKARRLKRLEELLASCEQEIADLGLMMEYPEVYSDYQKVAEIQEKLETLEEERDAYSEEWLEISEELETEKE